MLGEDELRQMFWELKNELRNINQLLMQLIRLLETRK